MDLVVIGFIWMFVITILIFHAVVGQIERLVAFYQSVSAGNVISRGLENPLGGGGEIC